MEFFINNSDDEDLMILTIGDHFVCPKYEEYIEIPSLWKAIVGNYDLYARTPSVYSDEEILGNVEIFIKDNVLLTSESLVLKTDDNATIKIVGGVFGGETMIYDEITGNITWQHLIYKPSESK